MIKNREGGSSPSNICHRLNTVSYIFVSFITLLYIKRIKVFVEIWVTNFTVSLVL